MVTCRTVEHIYLSTVNNNLQDSIPVSTTEVDHMRDPSANCHILDGVLQRYI